MPLGDRLRSRHHHHRRLIHRGDEYTLRELLDGEVELEEVPPDPDPPPGETRGEPWGWTKGPPYPRGYQEFIDHPPHGYRDGDDDDDSR